MTDSLHDYKRVGKIANKLHPPMIESYTPVVSTRDHRRGEIIRYFVRFITHNSPTDITEVSKTTYIKLKQNSLYRSIQIRWKVSGQLEDVFGLPNINTPVRLYTGVLTANKLGVESAEEDMPGLLQYITDYKRFWKL